MLLVAPTYMVGTLTMALRCGTPHSRTSRSETSRM